MKQLIVFLTVLLTGSFTTGIIGSTAFADTVSCEKGALITSQTYNFFEVSPEIIMDNLLKNATKFCNDRTDGAIPHKLDQTREVFRSSVPFLVQFEACFSCE